jgi:hypothetical protein
VDTGNTCYSEELILKCGLSLHHISSDDDSAVELGEGNDDD